MQTTNTKVYATKSIASMIAGKLAKKSGQEYQVRQVVSGFEVFAPSAVVEILTPVVEVTAAETGDLVTVLLGYDGESKSFVNIVHNDKKLYLGKSTLVSWEPCEVNGAIMVKVTMSAKQAKKRGLVQ